MNTVRIISDMAPLHFKKPRPLMFFAEYVQADGTRHVYRFASKAWRDRWVECGDVWDDGSQRYPAIRRAISAKRGRVGFSVPIIIDVPRHGK